MFELHCIGDSHTWQFLGRLPDSLDENDDINFYKHNNHVDYKNIKIYAYRCCGDMGALAYNIDKREFIINRILSSIDTSSKLTKILFMFGEIDCRYKINTYASNDNTTIEVCIEKVVNRYFDFITNNFTHYKNNICFWGPHGTTPATNYQYIDCSHQDRNRITKIFNDKLRFRCQNASDTTYIFCSIFDEMVFNNTTVNGNWIDVVHISPHYSRDKLLTQLYYQHFFTFGIITDGNNDYGINIIIESIKSQRIPYYEIIIVGNTSISGENIVAIGFDENIKNGWITKKKNIIAEQAKYENIVLLHDYIYFMEGWYEGFIKYGNGNNFKICINKIQNSNGERYRDYTFFPSKNRIILNYDNIPELIMNNALLPYDYIMNEKLIKYMYISGAYYVIKKDLALKIPLNEDKVWGEGEDVEFSDKLIINNIPITFNQYSSVKFIKYKSSCPWEKVLTHEQLAEICDMC